MKTFADIKRKLKLGESLTMIRHDWYPAGKLLNVERKIIKRQSNGIQFEGGSWLFFDGKASDYIGTNENTFLVKLDDDNFMGYTIRGE